MFETVPMSTNWTRRVGGGQGVLERAEARVGRGDGDPRSAPESVSVMGFPPAPRARIEATVTPCRISLDCREQTPRIVNGLPAASRTGAVFAVGRLRSQSQDMQSAASGTPGETVHRGCDIQRVTDGQVRRTVSVNITEIRECRTKGAIFV